MFGEMGDGSRHRNDTARCRGGLRKQTAGWGCKGVLQRAVWTLAFCGVDAAMRVTTTGGDHMWMNHDATVID